MSYKIDLALAVILAINVFLFLGQDAATAMNPDGVQFYNYEGSLLQDFDSGNYTVDEDVAAKLPTGEGSVSPTTGNLFTDAWSTLKSWLLDVPGVSYLLGIVNAMPNFLKGLGLPNAYVFALGAFWHALTLFLIIGWMIGRLG